MKISYVLPFFNNPESVARQVENWQKISVYNALLSELILVDDCSTVNHPVPRYTGLSLYRISSPIRWNQAGARNLGAFQSKADWLLLSDIDYLILPEDFKLIYDNLGGFDPDMLYFFGARNKEGVEIQSHPNSFLINRVNFLSLGGVDEDFVGHYGFEDIFFVKSWERYFKRSVVLSNIFLHHTGFHTDLERNTERNAKLLETKLQSLGSLKPKLRFDYERIL